MTRLRVASVNLGNHRVPGLSTVAQTRRLAAIVTTSDPDVVCIQEAHRGLVAPPTHRLIRQPGHGAAANPILVRRSLNIRGTGAEWVHGGRKGAWASKWITWVTLEDLGSIANLHVISGYDAGGRPRDTDSLRWELAARNITQAWRWAIEHRPGPLVIAGDLNAGLRKDREVMYPSFPAARLAEAGMTDVPFKRGTLGNRTPDRILHNRRWAVDSHRVIDRRAPFDHAAVVATLRELS